MFLSSLSPDPFFAFFIFFSFCKGYKSCTSYKNVHFTPLSEKKGSVNKCNRPKAEFCRSTFSFFFFFFRGGRVVRWSWVNFQCRGVLLVWIRVGQGPTALAVGAGGGCLDIFTLIYPFSSLSPSLWETTRYRLKYCLKGSLSPKTTNQPTLWLLLDS